MDTYIIVWYNQDWGIYSDFRVFNSYDECCDYIDNFLEVEYPDFVFLPMVFNQKN